MSIPTSTASTAGQPSAAAELPPAFDPFNQTVTLLQADGTALPVTMTDIENYVSYGIRICINYSSQLGACLILLVVLLLLTKRQKRLTPIFALNAASLALSVVRSLLQCLYWTGPFYHPYAFFSGDYSRVPPSQYRASIVGVVLVLLLVGCIEASLVLQVHVVCATLRPLWRRTVTASAVFIAALVVGFRFGLTVVNARSITAASDFTPWYWLANASSITTTVSICLFSACFVVKLGFAIHQRRRLGLKRFGPMQIIFVMGCQTMVVPALFAILQYTAPVPELGSQVLSVVAIFLPLSSIWASATLENAAVDNVPNQKFGPALPSPGNSGTSRRALIGQRNESGAGTATALGSGSGTGSITAFKHKRVSDIDEDLEAVASDSIKLEKRSLV